jgi:hypothetical protein
MILALSVVNQVTKAGSDPTLRKAEKPCIAVSIAAEYAVGLLL